MLKSYDDSIEALIEERSVISDRKDFASPERSFMPSLRPCNRLDQHRIRPRR
jgi:hypothetical protein